MERWLSVPGYEGLYEVSDRGRVRSLDHSVTQVTRWGNLAWHQRHGRVLRPSKSPQGRFQVVLCRHGRTKNFMVHDLVLGAFAGPCPPGMNRLHGPGGKQDNRWPENLYYGTPARNQGPDKYRDGTMPLGSSRHNAKLTEDIVREVRVRYATGASQISLAREFGVSCPAMRSALIGKTWRHV